MFSNLRAISQERNVKRTFKDNKVRWNIAQSETTYPEKLIRPKITHSS